MGKIIAVLAAAAALPALYWVSVRAWKAIWQTFPKIPDKEYPAAGMQLRVIIPEYTFDDFIGKFNFAGAKLLPASGSYNITYTNRNGITTNRNISVSRAYENNGKFIVDAYCHLHASRRSFSNHRINRAVDLNTGKFVNDLAQHAIASFDDLAIQKTWQTIGYEMMALYLLGFLCCTDHRMLKTERDIMAGYLKRRRPDIVLEDDQLERMLKRLGMPDPRQFKKIVSDMKATGDTTRLRDIADCAMRIAATQKTADPLEKAVIEMFQEASGKVIPIDNGCQIQVIAARKEPSTPREALNN
ncbi:MAG: TerB family tellurite resistance protein [Nitrosomonas sp.]|jgi:hypothetical protein|nr:TerB family tellurite resistance protein [Nitrosomonas sp.]